MRTSSVFLDEMNGRVFSFDVALCCVVILVSLLKDT